MPPSSPRETWATSAGPQAPCRGDTAASQFRAHFLERGRVEAEVARHPAPIRHWMPPPPNWPHNPHGSVALPHQIVGHVFEIEVGSRQRNPAAPPCSGAEWATRLTPDPHATVALQRLIFGLTFASGVGLRKRGPAALPRPGAKWAVQEASQPPWYGRSARSNFRARVRERGRPEGPRGGRAGPPPSAPPAAVSSAASFCGARFRERRWPGAEGGVALATDPAKIAPPHCPPDRERF